ncbi:hypothetical protein F1559_003672 [Cyanidiococcus yangmingshanensis]|uniref:Uncharacterized protein n=1 Tax=Cyanidiococcus yangmingshanensis TaxID=2690220 RepID=A0A7J7IE36_9RHOD|nr:hypothetical protein F1559_003672 [Cyanidiococcus yangmingshanensis]
MDGSSGAGSERKALRATRLTDQPPANVFLYAPKMRTELPDPPMDLKLLRLNSANGLHREPTETEAGAEVSVTAQSSTSAAALARKVLQLWEQERDSVERLCLCTEGIRSPGGMWLLELAAAFADTSVTGSSGETSAPPTTVPWTYRPLRGQAAQLVRNESALASLYATAEAERTESVDDPTSIVQSLGRVALSNHAAGAAFQALNNRTTQWMRPPQYDEFLSLKAGGNTGVGSTLHATDLLSASSAEATMPVDKRSAAEIAADALAIEAEFEAAAQLDQRLGELSYPVMDGEQAALSNGARHALRSLPVLPDEQLWSQPSGLVSFTDPPASWRTRSVSYAVARENTTQPSLAFFTEDASNSSDAEELLDEFFYQLETPDDARELAAFMCLQVTEDAARIAPVQYRVRPRPTL